MSADTPTYVATFKFGPYQAHSVTVRGDDMNAFGLALEDVKTNVDHITDVIDLLVKAAEAKGILHDSAPAQGPAVPAQRSAPVTNTGSAQGPGPSCPHGNKVYKESKPGAARAWKAWMCPAPQGDASQCKPEWIK